MAEAEFEFVPNQVTGTYREAIVFVGDVAQNDTVELDGNEERVTEIVSWQAHNKVTGAAVQYSVDTNVLKRETAGTSDKDVIVVRYN